ncbi:tyrosine-type recombinase/integrase [Microcella sp.]|uniref:tyrosine-type recombinase/integrase n=1 Tax=Microcella sp. TaxID=1913979 RepID=UPI00391CC881
MFANEYNTETLVSVLWDGLSPALFTKIAPGTQRAYSVAWRLRVAPVFGDRAIGSLTTLDVEVAFAKWTGSESTRADALGALSALCRLAVKGGFIASNPCTGVDRRRDQAPDVAARALTASEFRRLLELLPSSGPYRRFVLAMAYTGCRLGEVAGLRVADVDWDSRTVRVSRTASAGVRGEVRVGPTKGRRVRNVPVVDQLLPLLLEAAEGKGAHEYLFTGPRGGFINSKNLSRALDWHSIRDQIKTFGPDENALHWHDLRHTAAVFFFEAGLPAPDVQAILGHSSLLVTQLYADTRQLAARRAVPALSQYLSAQSRGQLEGGDQAAKTASDLVI